MASIYSTRFIGVQVVAGTPVTYTVPAGNVAVVRSISCTPLSSGLTAAYVAIASAAYIWHVATGTTLVSLDWEGRQVLNAGEGIQAVCTGANCSFVVSGYLLTP